MTGTRQAGNGPPDDEMPGGWMSQVVRQLTELTHQQGATAVTLERINGRLEMLDERVKRVEGGPVTTRAWLSIGIAALGGCLIPVVLTTAGLALTAVGILLQVLTTHH